MGFYFATMYHNPGFLKGKEHEAEFARLIEMKRQATNPIFRKYQSC
jgi:hypothetical protein